LLLKNKFKGTDTEGFKRNKEILGKWEHVIDSIVDKREAKKKYMKKM
jgi:hypothetical protein